MAEGSSLPVRLRLYPTADAIREAGACAGAVPGRVSRHSSPRVWREGRGRQVRPACCALPTYGCTPTWGYKS